MPTPPRPDVETTPATARAVSPAGPEPPQRMPWPALVVLALLGFFLVTAETLPAGLLPQIADGLGTSEGGAGQLVSLWALGTVLVTVPAIALTSTWPRRRLLLTVVALLAVANTVTALSGSLAVALVSRFVAGGLCGTAWGMLAPFGMRISPRARIGLALSVVSVGAPVGFALGTPLGTFLGNQAGWRWGFGALTVLAVLLLVLVRALVPDAPGSPRTQGGASVVTVLRLPGVAIVLAVIAAWMLAHNTLYTYVAPYLRESGTGLRPDLVLMVYGVASVASILVTGALLDRYPRALLHGSLAVFVLAGVGLTLGHSSTVAVLVAAVAWGLGFGGASAQLQSALSRSGREHSDVANSFLPVAFNIAIFLAGATGAVMLGALPAVSLAVLMIVLGLVALGLVVAGRRTAFAAR